MSGGADGAPSAPRLAAAFRNVVDDERANDAEAPISDDDSSAPWRTAAASDATLSLTTEPSARTITQSSSSSTSSPSPHASSAPSCSEVAPLPPLPPLPSLPPLPPLPPPPSSREPSRVIERRTRLPPRPLRGAFLHVRS